MSKALRLSEKWYQRGLWLVALLFAAFLIGLGGKVVENLNLVEEVISAEKFIDTEQLQAANQAARAAQESAEEAMTALRQAEQKHGVAEANTRSAQDTFENWIATRRATARPEQDTELIERTRQLESLRAEERRALSLVEIQKQKRLDSEQASGRADERIWKLRNAAQAPLQSAQLAQELRVFAYRLALTLPLLLIAGWLWKAQRKNRWWPFTWGFIFFALFTFFVELVPYLPSYGGYVRYLVGIVLTVIVGRQAILGLHRYLERQKAAEALPEPQRRTSLGYDTALARIGKSVCPGCERTLDMKDPHLDFCPHCSIGLFNRCTACTTRKNAFSRFCQACSTPAVIGKA